jgi:hypothetical protein
MKNFVLFSIVGLTLSFSSCRKAVPEVDVSTLEPRVVLLQEAQEVGAIRAAVIAALQSRGWAAEQETGQQIAARLVNRGATVRVNINYEPSQVVITGVQAEGAGKNYDKWVRNLEASIREAFKRPTPMVAPAAVVTLTPPPTLVMYGRDLDIPAAKAIIQKSLTAHSWVLESDGASGMVARLSHKKGLVRVTVLSNGQNATITYLNSEGLDLDAAGHSDDYERWMRILVEAIAKNSK